MKCVWMLVCVVSRAWCVDERVVLQQDTDGLSTLRRGRKPLVQKAAHATARRAKRSARDGRDWQPNQHVGMPTNGLASYLELPHLQPNATKSAAWRRGPRVISAQFTLYGRQQCIYVVWSVCMYRTVIQHGSADVDRNLVFQPSALRS
jgi:hypothetical protein